MALEEYCAKSCQACGSTGSPSSTCVDQNPTSCAGWTQYCGWDSDILTVTSSDGSSYQTSIPKYCPKTCNKC